MIPEPLVRFRAMIAAKETSLTEVSKRSGISITSLHNMSKPDWLAETFDRIESLDAALDAINRERAAS